ncbi:serine hydrolase domain-containing protein [Bacillus sp. CGMCC 1.16607]|uniref:serine hydrolase domain-containing protein n=1 Tax=Bacillus sp. CGMCC 1.16607 TaxID=3351842 RepID=UPI0036255E96
MEEVRNYLSEKNFSGVVSILKNRRIVFEHAFGWADKENQIKNKIDTKFCVGSMLNKPLTAVSILQLIQRGKLTLTQSIEDFFPHYQGKGITIHHLLNHTSGIVNYLMLRNKIKWDQDYTPEQILDVVEQHRLKFPPGKKSSYNNTGYLMLGIIIEKITGMSYYDYVRENILIPSGMVNTGFISEGVNDVALNYINQESGPHISPSVLFACGETFSTVEDIHQFDLALKTQILLNEESINLMEHPSYKGKYVTIGYGWIIKNLFGRKSMSHGGTHPGGYTTHLERYIKDDITIVVLSNNTISYSKFSMKELGGTWICREISSILFDQKLHFWQKFI